MIGRTVRRLRRLDDGAVSAWRTVRGAESTWDGIAELVTTRPLGVLLTALLVLIPPLAALPALELSHDELAELPDSAESVRGYDAVSEHISPGELGPLVLVIDDQQDVLEGESFDALGQLSENLKDLPQVGSVRSAAMPTDGRAPGSTGGVDQQIGSMTDQLRQAAEGAHRIDDGVEQLEAGVTEIDRRLPELLDGLQRARDGAERIEDGARQAREGVTQLRSGVTQLRDGVTQLRDGLGQLRSGLVEARDGIQRLHDEVAVPAERNVREGYLALFEFTVGRSDPRYEEAARELGDVYARITGEYPPGHPQAGQQVQEDYHGLPEALGRLSDGLGEAIGGVDHLDEGLAQLDDGLTELDDGLAQLGSGLERLASGADELESGLQRAVDGVQQLVDGIDQLLAGIGDQLEPGIERLATGLSDGVQRIEQTDFDALLPTGDSPGPFVITPGILEAMPDVEERLGLFVSQDGTATRIFLGMAQAPYDRASIRAVDDIEEVARRSLNNSPLEDAEILPTGTTAFFAEVDEIASRDFRIIVVAVVLGIFLVLALLLRSLIAPLYMVATVLLSFGVALGITTAVFQGLLGVPGIAWYVPSFLFVLLVALGVDYNIFLMSRVREEALHGPTTPAVATGLRLTGRVITSAGLILAGTFAALMVAPLRSLAQIGFAVTVGVLLDTFLVRTFLVPSIAVLLGRWNWWPSARGRQPHPAEA